VTILSGMKLVRMVLALLPLTAACAPQLREAEVVPHSYGTEYAVGGHARGVIGIGLALRGPSGEVIHVDDDGKFVFPRRLEDGAEYEVSIVREPISPVQSCVVARARGRIDGRNAMGIEVSCATISFEGVEGSEALAAR
jgi:hypothetical protein